MNWFKKLFNIVDVEPSPADETEDRKISCIVSSILSDMDSSQKFKFWLLRENIWSYHGNSSAGFYTLKINRHRIRHNFYSSVSLVNYENAVKFTRYENKLIVNKLYEIASWQFAEEKARILAAETESLKKLFPKCFEKSEENKTI